MPQTVKDAIASIANIGHDTNSPLIDILRPWMTITGLGFKDALHLVHHDLIEGLMRVHNKLGESLDIFDEDQLQEAACRCLGRVTVYGEMITDGDIAIRHGQNIEWDGTTWVFISDPKMRMRGTSKSYPEALATVQKIVGA
jgi:hypothetical protein